MRAAVKVVMPIPSPKKKMTFFVVGFTGVTTCGLSLSLSEQAVMVVLPRIANKLNARSFFLLVIFRKNID
jgi:hypothetical protein